MPPASHRATVYAGPSATDYVRAGNGATVLLLTRQHAEHPLFAALASAFRVIAPELPRHVAGLDGAACSAPPFASWLRDFLDGLGIQRVSVVADELFALDALRFCLAEPTRVDCLVIPSEARNP
jgi:pimeloyl-ACP methyl ester carboxylesterase